MAVALLAAPQTLAFVAMWSSVTAVGVLTVGSVVARRVSDPLVQLARGARQVAEGDFSAKVATGGSAEMTELAKTFNQMTDSLRERSDSLTKKMLELSTLYEMSRAVGGTFDLEELLDSVLESGMRIFDVSLGYAALRDRENGTLQLIVCRGIDNPDPRLVSASMASWVVREGRPLVCNPESGGSAGLDALTRSSAALSVPLRNGDQVVGALTIGTADPDYRFDAEDVRLLSTIANQVTMAVGNIELFSHLQEAYLATVRSLAAAIDAKDAYTRGHSDRVAAYAVAIAERLGLPAEQRLALEMAAYLHDIGKIGIPEGILRKAGKLEDAEMAQMRHHPLIGASILKPVAFPWSITPIVRHHHEAWDGSGYPAGLKEEEIPLSARILTVADSYEAMVSDRPYRKGRDPRLALGELKRCAGTQFDPALVGLFSAIILEAEADGSLPITGATEDVELDEAFDTFLALADGVLESFGRLGGDRLVANVEGEVNALYAEAGLPFRIVSGTMLLDNDGALVPDEAGTLRDALRILDVACAHSSGPALLDHFYAEAMATMPARQRAIAEELQLLPGAGGVAVA
ncbi:MAG: HD domain-containing protein [Coriobacteriales bacterium]|nr:HD domain-containing protein [Coriobacteriales bacterium]